ncbi:MAG: L-serine ammonia-lyase, iron-sulfur-dependent, subunit alpha [Eubacteriales bacterium]|nr:L-serine ammonia-lyase, iron-sulfur-dependent, subunit alpha [Eubacteriales bacterium]
MNQKEYLELLKQEIAPAVGCTEPIAVAYAVAKAKCYLTKPVQKIAVSLSRNMMKNAMGVGIPGTGMAGIGLAAALGAFGGDAGAQLEVLHQVSPEDVTQAKLFAANHVTVSLKDTSEKLYVEAIVESKSETVSVTIARKHTHIVRIIKDGVTLYDGDKECASSKEPVKPREMTIQEIDRFARETPLQGLQFLNDAIQMNRKIANEGLKGDYGLRVGKISYEGICNSGTFDDGCEYAVALAAAAADARMSGSQSPVMTICGSGNQGITAMVPIIAACDYFQRSQEECLRALALSCLITIHVKGYIGKLSPICGCGMGSSIGVCAAVTYLLGGTLKQIEDAISNVIADVSGIICDGAKSGCALKVATVVSSAFRGARLALKGSGAGSLDGIVSSEVETSIRNIGRLGNEGMIAADRVILDMMTCKS